jgi:hypothetical protein
MHVQVNNTSPLLQVMWMCGAPVALGVASLAALSTGWGGKVGLRPHPRKFREGSSKKQFVL